jgi:hypothetical protein
LTERKRLLTDLFPWDEANYGIDERWARIVPYGQTARRGDTVELEIRILNHSAKAHDYTVTPHVPEGFQVVPDRLRLTVDSRQESSAAFTVSIPASARESVAVLTADIAFGPWDLRRWCEAIIEVQP